MHHTATMYGHGVDTDGYGQTAIGLTNDGISSTEGNNNSCSYFNGQASVITDHGWAVSYTNGLTPMKQMEGEKNFCDLTFGI